MYCYLTVLMLLSQALIAGIEVKLIDIGTLPASAGLISAVPLPGTDDVVVAGTAIDAGLETIGPPFEGITSLFVARAVKDGSLRYFRYLNLPSTVAATALGPEGDVWILTDANPGAVYDATIDLTYPGTDWRYGQYLVRVAAADGAIRSVTRLEPWPARSVAVNSKGSVWLGIFSSSGIHITSDSISATRSGSGLVRLSQDADAIEFAAYLGGYAVRSLAIDSNDDVFAAGSAIWKVSSQGQLLWSTVLPPGVFLAAAVGSSGDLYAGGCTSSRVPSLYTTSGVFQEVGEGSTFGPPRIPQSYPVQCFDGFVARFDTDGNLIYSTYIGGPTDDNVLFLLPLKDGSVVMAGETWSFTKKAKDLSWLVLTPAIHPMQYIAKLTSDGAKVDYLTSYLPGPARYGIPFLFSDSGSIGSLTADERLINGKLSFAMAVIDETPPLLPRIDAIEAIGAYNTGYRLRLGGEGFRSEPIAVFLDDQQLQATLQPDGSFATAPFMIQYPREDSYPYLDSHLGAYQLKVVTASGAESRAVTAALFYRAQQN